MFNIDTSSNVPLYEQLKNSIIELSFLGLLKENDALPSIRTLAKELGINPNTVSKAYSILETDQMIYSIAGKGSFLSKNDTLLSAYIARKQAELVKNIRDLQRLGIKKEDFRVLLKEENIL